MGDRRGAGDGLAHAAAEQVADELRLGGDRREALAPEQRPFAVLFGCSDSRLAAEIIFDRGLGDLFVVRVAGNFANTDAIASFEYAVKFLGTTLLVVLGHDKCGAVDATIKNVASQPPSGIGLRVTSMKRPSANSSTLLEVVSFGS